MRKFLLLVLLAALVVVPTLAQEEGEPPRTGIRPDAPPYAIRGPHPVGFMTFDNGNAERPITGAIWYPAVQPEGVEEAIVYDHGIGDIVPFPVMNEMAGRAILNAEPDTAAGPYPLVISSHGLMSPIFALAYLHEQLASYGFVVIAPNHPGSTFHENMSVNSEETWRAFQESAIDNLVLRPLDIVQTLDYAETLAGPDGNMAGVIDMEQVSAIGWSFGGYTALAAAGGQLDFSGMPEMCVSDPWSTLAAWMCMLHADDLTALETHLIETAGVEAEPGQMWPSMADERIDAIVPLAGGSAVITGAGYTNIRVPMLLLQGGDDTSAVPKRGWEYSSSTEKILVTLEHAGHMLIGACPGGLVETVPDFFSVCSDPVWDMDRAHDLINHFTTAFLLAELYGDEDARAALAPDAVAFPGIGYEAVGY
jgi:predicted dienelactone hydrolase